MWILNCSRGASWQVAASAREPPDPPAPPLPAAPSMPPDPAVPPPLEVVVFPASAGLTVVVPGPAPIVTLLVKVVDGASGACDSLPHAKDRVATPRVASIRFILVPPTQ